MIVINKYATTDEANFKIRGGIIGGTKVSQRFENLVGRTITFSNPAGACTFTQPTTTAMGQLRFADVKAQIEAVPALADVVVATVDNKLGFYRRTFGQNIGLAALDEPARLILGFANNTAIAGQCLNASAGPNPRYLGFVSEFGAIYITTEVD
jgi:hypothetical protein